MPVAIKMMRHNMVIDSSFLLNFHKEARIIASLNHENILSIYDFEERYKTVFIIMEFLDGESLHDLLQRLKIIPPTLAVSYVHQICEGLIYAHKKGIIHRDINPANVMVLPNDRIKILDFGLACHLGTEDENIGGVLAYQAPELLEGNTADQRSDVYALGITAYELVTGHKPFDDEKIIEMFRLGTPRDLTDSALLVPNMVPELRAFILKACQHERANRYRNVEEALEVLHPAISENNRNNLESFNDSGRTDSGTLTTITLRYEPKQQAALNRLLSEFSLQTSKIGVDLKLQDSND